MTRRLALIASLCTLSAMPAFAQAHTPPPHGQAFRHGPGHVPPDPATRDLLHALFHGTWTGTLRSPEGAVSALRLSASPDTLQGAKVSLYADRPSRGGDAKGFVLTGDTLQWTQDLSGVSCRASALVSGTSASAPQRLQGKITCVNGESTFSLSRT